MDFQADKAIYLQIADYVCEQILLQQWLAGEKIPSVRELAVTLSVNPNTVIRSYAWLQDMQVINMQRGMGYFVADRGRTRVLELKKQAFFKEELPRLFRQMDLLGLDIKQLTQLYGGRSINEKE
jgi:DNA-binding transcriptional regulator YhcF (GntR family)